MSRVTTPSLLLVALATAGCPLPPEVIGETLTTPGSGATGESVGDSTTTTAGGNSTSIEGSTTGEDSLGEATGGDSGATTDWSGGVYGSYCELLDPPYTLLSPVVSPQPLCDGDICVLVKDAPFACFGDAECVEEKGAGSQCDDDGWCTETAEFLAANTRCTQTCESLADCPPIPGCTAGITCGPAITIGPLCCQKMCLCNDHLYIPTVTSNEQSCVGDPEFCSG